MNEEAPVKRWTAKRKSAVVINIFNVKATPTNERPHQFLGYAAPGAHPALA